MASSIPTIAKCILAFELFLGGQARLTSALTPTLHRRVKAKAEGTRRELPFIPIRNAVNHTRVVGGAMCLAGSLLLPGGTRLSGGMLAISLTIAGVYSQYRMGIAWWLPAINTVLAAIIISNELRRA